MRVDRKLYRTLSWILLIIGIGGLITGHIDLYRWPKDAQVVVFFLGLITFFAPLRDD
jgi:hypothetical protein